MDTSKPDLPKQAAKSEPQQTESEGRNGFTAPFVVDERVREDWLWVHEQYALGALDRYHGLSIAVVGKTIHASGRNAFELQEEVCRRLGVPPEVVVIKYVD